MERRPLECPSCARRFTASERFCEACAMPLVYARDEQHGPAGAPSDRHRRARKIKPQLSEGALVKVARAANQAEAELIAGLLLEQGVPSMLRRSAGADVPDFLAAGPRDVLVPESAVQTAREALAWQPQEEGSAGLGASGPADGAG